jgi:hypothetical protein
MMVLVTQHLRDRLKQRTNIKNVDSFISEVLSKRDEIEKLDIYSSNLSKHPQVMRKIHRNPIQRVWVIDWVGYYLLEENNSLITVFPIKKFDKIIYGGDKIINPLHHHN